MDVNLLIWSLPFQLLEESLKNLDELLSYFDFTNLTKLSFDSDLHKLFECITRQVKKEPCKKTTGYVHLQFLTFFMS